MFNGTVSLFCAKSRNLSQPTQETFFPLGCWVDWESACNNFGEIADIQFKRFYRYNSNTKIKAKLMSLNLQHSSWSYSDNKNKKKTRNISTDMSGTDYRYTQYKTLTLQWSLLNTTNYTGLQFLTIMPHEQVLVSTVISSNIITHGALTLAWFGDVRIKWYNRPASQQHILRKHYIHRFISVCALR